ncbi:hypothetical protein [Streptomyces sp. NPDC051776]|uniref:hypothetical protein n=1 Tax=Streptomyces sp. NPDC051776 TaxID=3155414 RepID=UPI003447C687
MVSSPAPRTAIRPDHPRTGTRFPGFARRHRRLLRVLAGVLAAVVIFLAGVGTAGIVIVGQMKSTMRSVLAGGGGLPPGPSTRSGGPGSSGQGTDDDGLRDWAKKQDCPRGCRTRSSGCSGRGTRTAFRRRSRTGSGNASAAEGGSPPGAAVRGGEELPSGARPCATA